MAATKLGRGSAGALVAARADRFAADLLEQELTEFAGMGRRLAAAATTAGNRVRKGWREGVLSPDVSAMVSGDLRRALTACGPGVVTLAAGAAADGLASITEELGWCEQTLAKRYAGVADAAVAAARADVTILREQTRTGWAAAVPGWVGTFETAMRAQVALARDEDAAALEARLLSRTPIRARGLNGRGVWWSAYTAAQEAARAYTIGAANTVRSTAMINFDRGLASRG